MARARARRVMCPGVATCRARQHFYGKLKWVSPVQLRQTKHRFTPTLRASIRSHPTLTYPGFDVTRVLPDVWTKLTTSGQLGAWPATQAKIDASRATPPPPPGGYAPVASTAMAAVAPAPGLPSYSAAAAVASAPPLVSQAALDKLAAARQALATLQAKSLRGGGAMATTGTAVAPAVTVEPILPAAVPPAASAAVLAGSAAVPAGTGKKWAYVTILSTSRERRRYIGYMSGILVADRALKKLNTNADFWVFVVSTPGVERLPEKDESLLVRNQVKFKYITPPWKMPTNSVGGVMLTKIYCWTLEQYERVLYIDSDVFPTSNMDQYFATERSTGFAGGRSPLNGGFLVLKPSQTVFDRMSDLIAKKGDIAEGDQPPVGWNPEVGWGSPLEKFFKTGGKFREAKGWHFNAAWSDQVSIVCQPKRTRHPPPATRHAPSANHHSHGPALRPSRQPPPRPTTSIRDPHILPHGN